MADKTMKMYRLFIL